MKTWTPERILILRRRLRLTQTSFGVLLGYANPQIRVSELERGIVPVSGKLRVILGLLAR
jgi:DNA-binding transcriptional regulator YiaG